MSTADGLPVDHLGPAGDGVVRTENGPVFIPGALPGEKVGFAAERYESDRSSPERRTPFCGVFGQCGGCTAQHMSQQLYSGWKHDMVRRAVAKAGLSGNVAEPLIAHGDGRRRAIIHVRFDGRGEPRAGFMEPRSHNLLALESCPVLTPGLTNAFEAARRVARPLARRGKPLDVQATATDAGLDIDIRGHGKPEPDERLALTDIATQLDLARLSLHRDVIVERRPPIIRIAGGPLVLPARSFLQATAAAEDALAALALDGIGKARSVADLFCGVGPFALALATRAKVAAYDGDADAIGALNRAIRSRQGLKPITAETRDLFRRPLLPQELNGFDAVVLDPPRAGAEAQMRQIAASKVARVVSISCDLASFIRDGLILQDSGFRMERLTPVDQFAWTRHIELVGVFVR